LSETQIDLICRRHLGARTALSTDAGAGCEQHIQPGDKHIFTDRTGGPAMFDRRDRSRQRAGKPGLHPPRNALAATYALALPTVRWGLLGRGSVGRHSRRAIPAAIFASPSENLTSLWKFWFL
jgi:hypothetical protein